MVTSRYHAWQEIMARQELLKCWPPSPLLPPSTTSIVCSVNDHARSGGKKWVKFINVPNLVGGGGQYAISPTLPITMTTLATFSPLSHVLWPLQPGWTFDLWSHLFLKSIIFLASGCQPPASRSLYFLIYSCPWQIWVHVYPIVLYILNFFESKEPTLFLWHCLSKVLN